MTHNHLLEDNLDWHAEYLQISLEAIRSKKVHYHPNDLLNPHMANVAEIYDGLRYAINRPQGQYAANGNWLDIQANVYSGNVKVCIYDCFYIIVNISSTL